MSDNEIKSDEDETLDGYEGSIDDWGIDLVSEKLSDEDIKLLIITDVCTAATGKENGVDRYDILSLCQELYAWVKESSDEAQ